LSQAIDLDLTFLHWPFDLWELAVSQVHYDLSSEPILVSALEQVMAFDHDELDLV
jgi:hypothetical protein